jgi:hypothetical protein
MRNNRAVKWTLKNGRIGYGMTASEEYKGKILVAVHAMDGHREEMHVVICCNTTWLTEIDPSEIPEPKDDEVGPNFAALSEPTQAPPASSSPMDPAHLG